MWELLSRYRAVTAIALLLAAPLVLLYAETRNPSARGPIVSVIIDVAGVIERGMLAFTGAVSDGLERYVTSVAHTDELFALRRERAFADVQEARIRSLEAENELLRRLTNTAERIDGPRPIGARIIGRSGEPLSRIARIDRGRRDGVRRGDGVVSAAGIVGRVHAVGAISSDVLLLTDPQSVVDVVVARSRARGLVRGTGDSETYRARIEDFDRLADVQKDDLLVTSGLDPAWPDGLLVGRVTLVEDRSDGLYRRAELAPAAPLATVEHVLVLIRADVDLPPVLAGGDDGNPRPTLDRGPPPEPTGLPSRERPEPASTSTPPPSTSPAPKPAPAASPPAAVPPTTTAPPATPTPTPAVSAPAATKPAPATSPVVPAEKPATSNQPTTPAPQPVKPAATPAPTTSTKPTTAAPVAPAAAPTSPPEGARP